MRRLFDFMETVMEGWKYICLLIVHSFCLGGYLLLSDGLEKPAGFISTVKFLLNNSKEYFGAMLLGICGVIIIIILVIASIVEGFSIVASYESGKELVVFIFKIILVLLSLTLDFALLKGLGSLIFVMATLAGLLYLWASSSN